VHVLVIDVEYLVALEAEQVLTEQLGYTVDIAVPREIPQSLETRRFDVLFLNASLLSAPVEAAVQRLRASGIGVVFSSVDRTHRIGMPAFPGIPVIARPFDDQELVEKVKSAAGALGAVRRSTAEGA
jgi:DNA-binding response OmpR family regulator